MDVLDDLVERGFDAVDIVGNEGVAVAAPLVGLDAGRGDHVVNAGVGEAGKFGVLADEFEVVGEGAAPGQALLLGPVLLQPLDEIECRGLLPKCDPCPGAVGTPTRRR